MEVDDAVTDAGPRAALMDVVDADGLTTPTPTSCRTRSHR
jgi:hypothetical protein